MSNSPQGNSSGHNHHRAGGGPANPPFPQALTDVLRATLSLVEYYAPPAGTCATLCDLKRAIHATLAELEITAVSKRRSMIGHDDALD